jgi:hypothetical protein
MNIQTVTLEETSYQLVRYGVLEETEDCNKNKYTLQSTTCSGTPFSGGNVVIW